MPIKDMYQGIIRDIMAEHGVEPVASPGYVVMENTGFADAIQYTNWYVAGGGDSVPHYRYKRYMSKLQSHLQNMPVPANRLAHVDIGCGAGLFSWVFLDWAAQQNIEYGRVSLYGIDHCQAMIDIAEIVRTKLLARIANYPHLHYFRDVNDLITQLTSNHQVGTIYIVTFGHVLIQANTPENIRNFARIIAHIVKPNGLRARCQLVIVDAFSGSRPAQLEVAKEALRNSLAEMGVRWG